MGLRLRKIGDRLAKAGRRLWHDRRGAVSASQILLVMTIVSIGAVVGLSTLRDHIVQEFGDISLALENLDQSYNVTIEDPNGNVITESIFVDDDPDPAALEDPDGGAPAGISVHEPPSGEN